MEIFEQYEACEERIAFIEKTLRQSDDELKQVLNGAYEKEKEVLNAMLIVIVGKIESIDDPYARTIMHLKYIGEMRCGKRYRLKNWEIANRMNYSEEWVKKKLQKVKRQLKIEKV